MGKSMNVLGIECNVGSQLYPFKKRGYNIIGGIDSRGICKREDWLLNFPSSHWFEDENELLKNITEVDIVMSQPNCSKFCGLNRSNNKKEPYNVWKLLSIIRPKLFFIESKLDYLDLIEFLPGYKYQVEWVSNYGYGNTQLKRNRLWVIGIRNDYSYIFLPNEKYHNNKAIDKIIDLPKEDVPELDHIHKRMNLFKNSLTGERYTDEELFDELKSKGFVEYVASDGTIKKRIGRRIMGEIFCPTLTGNPNILNPLTKLPLTPREVLRLQGFDDNFKLTNMSYSRKYKAAGKSMPQEFVEYLVDTIEGKLPNNPSKIINTPQKLSLFKNIHNDKIIHYDF